MDKILYDKIYNEALAIGEGFMNSSMEDENGKYWKTMSLDDDLNLAESVLETMYNGNAGIALFLLELHRVTGEKKYLDYALSAMNWVFKYCANNRAYQYGFYTGRISVSIAAIRFYEFTKDKIFLVEALNAVKDLKSFNTEYTVDDLIGGNSGTLLGLMHLHAHTNEAWLLDEINRFAGLLMERMYIGKNGIYWDRIPDFVKSLCGFSHGAAGLGFVFLEAGFYLDNKAFFWLAEKAFEYEKQFYDSKKGNWVDLRRHKTTKQFLDQQKTAFLNNDIDYFTKERFMNAWCHGAAGIGLARLRAYELIKDERYQREAKTAVKTTAASDLGERAFNNLMIYCHGTCGNADLFIESVLRNGKYGSAAYAEKAAEMALMHKQINGFYRSDYRVGDDKAYEDKSLFTGVAGIGHFYLRVLMPEFVPSVLMPVLNKKIKKGTGLSGYDNLSVNKDDLKLKAYKKVFPKTIFMLENIDKGSVKELLKIKGSNNIAGDFINFFKKYINCRTPREQKVLKDIFKLEKLLFVTCNSISSIALLDIKRIIEDENANELLKSDEHGLLKIILKTNDTVILTLTKWAWDIEDIKSNLNSSKGTHFAVLHKHPKGVEVNFVNPLVYTILSLLKEKDTVENLLSKISGIFGVSDKDGISVLKEHVILQVKELIVSRYLISA